MKKALYWIFGIVTACGLVLYVTFWVMDKVTNYNEAQKPIEQYEEGSEEEAVAIVETNEVVEEFAKKNPKKIGNSEYAVQDAIHQMSHQKVHAEEKWGAMPATEANVKQVDELLKNNDYEHEKEYRVIIDLWLKGDFSNAVEAHNAIWKLQGGTLGEATGLLSPAEEEAFVKEYFK